MLVVVKVMAAGLFCARAWDIAWRWGLLKWFAALPNVYTWTLLEVLLYRMSGVTYLEFGKKILRQFLQKPVENKATLDTSLRMQDKDHLGVLWVVERFLDNSIAHSYIVGRVSQVPLDETFDNVKEDSRSLVVNTEDWPLEGEGKSVQIVLHPVVPDAVLVSLLYPHLVSRICMLKCTGNI